MTESDDDLTLAGMLKKYRKVGFLVVGVVVGLFLVFGFGNHWRFSSSVDAGTFGDSFGMVNALFSGLAFAGVVLALLIQSAEYRQAEIERGLQLKAHSEIADQAELSALASMSETLVTINTRKNLQCCLTGSWVQQQRQLGRYLEFACDEHLAGERIRVNLRCISSDKTERDGALSAAMIHANERVSDAGVILDAINCLVEPIDVLSTNHFIVDYVLAGDGFVEWITTIYKNATTHIEAVSDNEFLKNGLEASRVHCIDIVDSYLKSRMGGTSTPDEIGPANVVKSVEGEIEGIVFVLTLACADLINLNIAEVKRRPWSS